MARRIDKLLSGIINIAAQLRLDKTPDDAKLIS